ncbi:C45 family peptidase [Bacteroides sp. 519]|uniref:C45 family autoproteolytic acyltransferase/hydolase n=1 Tax=Bacteroides sp. 519 TaxID=2302937 RepID=UPI0013D41316|nr:C45 family peptidase [Bacteroides sp. 519]NDV60706.1 choloylglycine hydrolase [Bacteroides sp. 519]
MRKTLLKIVKYTVITFAAFIIVVALCVWYLYGTADMMTPTHEPENKYLLTNNDTCRTYGPNMLRKANSGLWELHVEGNAFERGEAIGKLSKDLLYYQENVFVNQIKEIIPSDNYLKFLRFFIVLFNRNLGKNVPKEYRDEIYGISLSCTHQYDFIGTPYERQLNYHAAHDLGHAMQDYMLVGCSSFAAWGEHTTDSTLLIGRNFDFYVGDDFARNKQIAFYRPATGYKFASVGWPGMTGVLSGMNEHGLTVTINAAKSAMPTSSATPISVLTREILQYASTIEEAYQIAQNRKTFVAESILVGSAKDGKAAIIEKSPDKIALYTAGKEKQLICTNHYQSEEFQADKRNIENIETSDSPYRYVRLGELLAENTPLTPVKAASILRNHKGLNNADLGLANEMAINQFIAHHSVIFKPEKRLMWVSTSPWQSGKFVCYDLDRIFGNSINFTSETESLAYTIPEDSFIYQPEFKQLLQYKELTPLIRKHTQNKEAVNDSILNIYRETNPNMFYTYEVLGDYYMSQNNKSEAQKCWKKALTLPIPKQGETDRIRKKLEN